MPVTVRPLFLPQAFCGPRVTSTFCLRNTRQNQEVSPVGRGQRQSFRLLFLSAGAEKNQRTASAPRRRCQRGLSVEGSKFARVPHASVCHNLLTVNRLRIETRRLRYRHWVAPLLPAGPSPRRNNRDPILVSWGVLSSRVVTRPGRARAAEPVAAARGRLRPPRRSRAIRAAEAPGLLALSETRLREAP